MRERFASMHVRAICHATEDPGKVEQALRCLVGDAEIAHAAAEGHHGNRIEVMEVVLDKDAAILEILHRLPRDCLREMLETLQMRLDDSCNLFARLDKQKAFGGELCLSQEGDVISMRVKIRAFPAKREIASKVIQEFVEERIADLSGDAC